MARVDVYFRGGVGRDVGFESNLHRKWCGSTLVTNGRDAAPSVSQISGAAAPSLGYGAPSAGESDGGGAPSLPSVTMGGW